MLIHEVESNDFVLQPKNASIEGSLLAFVIMLFWTANKQEKIDEEHGYSEREDD